MTESKLGDADPTVPPVLAMHHGVERRVVDVDIRRVCRSASTTPTEHCLMWRSGEHRDPERRGATAPAISDRYAQPRLRGRIGIAMAVRPATTTMVRGTDELIRRGSCPSIRPALNPGSPSARHR